MAETFDPALCGEPVIISGAPLTAPVESGPISNSTPLIISTLSNNGAGSGQEAPSNALPVTDGAAAANDGTGTAVVGGCGWLCILIALVVGYMLVRSN